MDLWFQFNSSSIRQVYTNACGLNLAFRRHLSKADIYFRPIIVRKRFLKPEKVEITVSNKRCRGCYYVVATFGCQTPFRSVPRISYLTLPSTASLMSKTVKQLGYKSRKYSGIKHKIGVYKDLLSKFVEALDYPSAEKILFYRYASHYSSVCQAAARTQPINQCWNSWCQENLLRTGEFMEPYLLMKPKPARSASSHSISIIGACAQGKVVKI